MAATGGEAVETVTSGPTAWSRTAADRSALARARWEPAAGTDDASWMSGGRVGIALVADLLREAGDRRHGPPGADGRRPLLATVPADEAHRGQFGEILAGAEVTVELDGAGDITHVVIRSGPGDVRELVVDLTIDQLGEADLIMPADVGGPARAVVPVGELEEAGLQLLEPVWLPAGWALTGASGDVAGGAVVRCGTTIGPCDRREDCPILALRYGDLTRVAEGQLSLSVQSDACVYEMGAGDGPDWAEPFTAGRFSGWVDETSMLSLGAVSDGETTVTFSTDLAAADAAVVLATLAPFDPATEPAVLPGVPSS